MSLSGAFVRKVFAMVVVVGATAVDVILMPETEISIALTVELVRKVFVIIVQSPGFSDAADPNVSTIVDDTPDRQLPPSLLSGVPFSRLYPLTPNQSLQISVHSNGCTYEGQHVPKVLEPSLIEVATVYCNPACCHEAIISGGAHPTYGSL
ncbi:hypothetical protein BDV38DRAFT_285116 [Aspergillus pseudotamarii]|uniref:Uncharacterized protein n=1 Tax=Aspergillus pseudotamarii TaxID=132259 RepID=A0A5N6SN47_ASPPS|nr:uncharacterized protein BDV38DRAFT_285116 [Aspergillus pseudotamarii]KAE8135289.1 hypothetical protein BDV38DRAFT_285116 [Aspergillus pseudotamarii]